MQRPHRLAFDHFGIAVQSISGSRATYDRLGIASEWTEEVTDPVQAVRIAFARIASGGPRIELVAPAGENSPVQNVLARSRGLSLPYHIALRTNDIGAALDFLRTHGSIQLTHVSAARAFGGSQIVFVSLKDGLVIELIEEP